MQHLDGQNNTQRTDVQKRSRPCARLRTFFSYHLSNRWKRTAHSSQSNIPYYYKWDESEDAVEEERCRYFIPNVALSISKVSGITRFTFVKRFIIKKWANLSPVGGQNKKQEKSWLSAVMMWNITASALHKTRVMSCSAEKVQLVDWLTCLINFAK